MLRTALVTNPVLDAWWMLVLSLLVMAASLAVTVAVFG